jgi:transposase
MYSIGIDVHYRYSNVCILDSQGQRVKEVRLKTPELVDFLKRQPGPQQICYEASLGYGVLYDQLTRISQRVLVAHPGHLRLIFRSKRKNDRVDARKLALLLFLNEVPTVYVPSLDYRNWRKLIETRQRRMTDRTRTKNRLRGLLRGQGIAAAPRQSLWTKKGLAWLRQIELPTPDVELDRDLLLDDLEQQQATLRRIERRLNQIGAAHPGVNLLRTIPGVGPRTAEAVVAYIADPRRFRCNRCVGSYFGLIPQQDQSADRNHLGHITREGPATVRRLLVEAAWQGIRRDERIQAYFERVQHGDAGRKKIALVATAHYLVRCMHAMLRTGEAWRTSEETAVTVAA